MQHKGLYRVSLRIALPFLCIVAAVSVAYAQDSKLTGALLGSPDHLVLTTTADKVSFQSVLSGDKRKVIITVKNAQVGMDNREVNSAKGLLQTAFVRQNGKDAVIIADLRDTAGFTAVRMPYSQSISVDFFKWNTLSASENAYRSGLLAWQNGAFEIARSYFQTAEQSGHPDGTAFLGFLYSLAGKTSEAAVILERALSRKSSYADIYGALASLEKSKNNEMKAREYENVFMKTFKRLPSYGSESIELSDVPNVGEEPISLLEMEEQSSNAGETVANSDTALKSSSDREEALVQQLRTLQGSSAASSPAKNTAPSVGLPDGVMTFLLGLAAAIALVAMFFTRSYLRWRKQQRMVHNAVASGAGSENIPPDFQSDLHSAMAMQEHVAAARYKAQEMSSASTKQPHTETDSSTTTKAEEPPDELFDFSEAFYAARERAAEKRRAELAALPKVAPVADKPTWTNAILNSDTPPQTSGGAALNTVAEDVQNADSNSGAPNAAAEEQDQGSARILPLDDESINKLALQIGLDPEVIKAQRRAKKTTGV
jgi:hypothetical protein